MKSLGDVRLPGRSDLANEKLFSILLTSYVAWAAVQAAETGGDSTVAPDNDQTGADPETERELEIGNAGAVNSEALSELEELSDDTNGASDAEAATASFK